MRSLRVPALVLGVTLLAGAVGVAYQSASAADQRAQDQDQTLVATAQHAAVRIADHFERAADVTLMLARDPSFHDFYTAPGSRAAKLAAGAPSVAAADDAMKYVETLFPGAVDEACFIDIATGAENGRIIRGMAMPTAALSHDEKSNVFFSHTVGLQPSYVYQSQPYKSSDTDQWVIGNATTVRVGGTPKAIVHFETTLESLRASALLNNGGVTLRVVDADQGTTLMDSRYLMSTGDSLIRKGDQDFVGAVAGWQGSGELTVDGERVAYDRMTPSATVRSVNGNLWYVVASAPVIVGGVTAAASPLALGLLALALPLLGYSLWSYVGLVRRQRASAARTRAERDRLADRLEQMTDALDRAAAGDLGVTLPVDLGDEAMNRLAEAFDRTLSRLRGLVGQAQDNSTRLAQAANQLRATASQQAGSATEQSAVVAETTATIEELAATAAQIAETASSVARVAQDTLHLTDDGRVAVRDSMSAMERISGKVDFIQQSSAGLGEKINEVGRILQLIDELSEQTNLLALNAAIEAARAGEHGRGFAVVASEVRKLAERAQESTSQIQAIVTEIQHHTRSTVMASEDGFREARQGTTLAQGAVDALDRIAGMVDETTTAAEEISIATQQQRSASDQVVVAMTQVSEVSRQYTAGSKETAAAAQEISGLALQMRASIEAFNVEQGADHEGWMSVHGGLPDDVDTARGLDGDDDELGVGQTGSRAGV